MHDQLVQPPTIGGGQDRQDPPPPESSAVGILITWSYVHVYAFNFVSQEFLPIETIRLRRLRLVVLQDLRSLRHMPWPPELRTCTCVYFDLQASDLAQQQAALRKDITAAAKKVGDAHVMIWSKPLDPIANFKIFWVGSIGERSRKGGEGWSEGKS